MVLARRLLVARAPVAEIEPLEDAFGLEQLHGAIDGGERDAVVHLRRAPVQLHHVRMVLGGIEHLRDDPALAGHAQALLAAGALDGVRPARLWRMCMLRVAKANPLLAEAYRGRGPRGAIGPSAMVSAATRVPSGLR